MPTKPNLKRILEALDLETTDEVEENVSEDEESNSDPDFSLSESESDDTSTDEHVSENDNSSDSYTNDDDIHVNIQPDTIEKNGVVWSKEKPKAAGRLHATNILKTRPGPVTKIRTILEGFKLFFTNEILDEVVSQTNKYARRYFSRQIPKRSNTGTNLKKWKLLDRIELEAFLGLLIQAGVVHANHRSVGELWDISTSCPLYHATMSLERFKHLLQFLRFDDREERNPSDRLAPIRFIFESFTKQLPRYFVPGENITVDEQLVPFRGRCSFVQYMRNKPSRYGLKFWMLSDVDTRFVLSLELYTGKVGNVIQRNLGKNVVLRLVDQLLDNVKQGRNVTYDRYFTDFDLAQALLERKMTSLGVVNHVRSFVPNELKVIRQDLYSSWFFFSKSNTILSYQAKEKKPPVILLSTSHAFTEVFDDQKKLPVMIHDYNQNKIGVDVIDQCINNYTTRRITRRWPMIVFFNLIDIAAINSMSIWLYENPDWNKGKRYVRRLFLEQLGKSLTNSHNERRCHYSYLTYNTKIALQSLGYELKSKTIIVPDHNDGVGKIKRRCYLCPTHPGRKIRQTCDACQNNVCKFHSTSITTVICQRCEANESIK